MTKQQLTKLTKILGKKNISVDIYDLEKHSKDYSFHPASVPEIVCYPTTSQQISEILKIANKHSIPVTAWGGGSSTEGNPIPVKGGIVLDIKKMNKILNINKKDKQVSVQSGIIVDELQKKLKKYNLFFPAAPGSGGLATIGGMIANNAGGMQAIKYGVVGSKVMQLEVVLADGTIITTGSKSIKSVSGYDLKHLFIGSEGTLGIITQVVLKAALIPETQIVLLMSFQNILDVVATASKILSSSINPAALEFMDSAFIAYSNSGKHGKLPEFPTLLIQLDGNKKQVLEEVKTLKKICKNSSIKVFKTMSEIENVWKYRKAGRTMIKSIHPAMGILAAEVGIPLSTIETFLKKTYTLVKKEKINTVIFGHIGDGNFHMWCLYKLNDKNSFSAVQNLNEKIILLALSLGGTTTGEHGIGIGKRKFLPIEHPTTIEIMKDLKQYFDKQNILNPGKMFMD